MPWPSRCSLHRSRNESVLTSSPFNRRFAERNQSSYKCQMCYRGKMHARCIGLEKAAQQAVVNHRVGGHIAALRARDRRRRSRFRLVQVVGGIAVHRSPHYPVAVVLRDFAAPGSQHREGDQQTRPSCYPQPRCPSAWLPDATSSGLVALVRALADVTLPDDWPWVEMIIAGMSWLIAGLIGVATSHEAERVDGMARDEH